MSNSTATIEKPEMVETNFEPRIVAFLCNWCSYAGANLAGTSRIQYAPNVRIIRVPCSGRVDPLFIAKAFTSGADGVMVLGCHPGDCHYREGNYYARRRFTLFHGLLDFLGIDARRVRIDWVSAAEGKRFAQVVTEFTDQVRQLGPGPASPGPLQVASSDAAGGTAVVRGSRQQEIPA